MLSVVAADTAAAVAAAVYVGDRIPVGKDTVAVAGR